MFPYDVTACPKGWAETTGKISFYRSHDKVSYPASCILVLASYHESQGGHFAALEEPDLLWQDVVEFVEHVKQSRNE